MRKIIVITQITLDGIMQAPGGPEEDPRGGFTQGGWIWPFADESLGEAVDEIVSREFDMILGRRTYEIFAAYWPYAGDNPIAKVTKATKYVVTNTLDRFDWKNTHRISGNPVDGVRQLKASDGPELHIWGIAAELVDEFRLWVFPVVLGKGKRLFEYGVPPLGLTLVESHSSPRASFSTPTDRWVPSLRGRHNLATRPTQSWRGGRNWQPKALESDVRQT